MSRLLLVRMDGLGDALVLTPLVAALRAAGHELGALLTARNAAAFSEGTLAYTHVVERIPWPRHGLEPASEARALEAVRAVGYDGALIASEEPAAYRFARAAGIRARTGFINGWEKPLKSAWTRRLLTRAIVRPASAARSGRHEVETLFALGDGLHAEAQPSRDPSRLRPLVIDGPRERNGCVVIQASPKFAGAGLDLAALCAIASALASTHDTLLCESPANAAFARAIGDRTGVPLRLPDAAQWKRLIDGADAIVTPDSGAAHVAGMTGTPCVDLFAGGPHADRDMQRWRPWAAPSLTLTIGGGPLAPRVADAVAQLARAGSAA
jgi:ADP-heptose:LPS heptosyltransferase